MQALLRYEALALELRIAQVTEIQANVLSELQEYRENSSLQFGAQIDEMISRIKALTEITKGESK
jgi:hypothetical protein